MNGTLVHLSPRRLLNRLRIDFSESFKRRFSLHLTIEGWLLVATMLLIGLAALNTAAPLLYLMFSMMCSFFILSALLASNTIRGISIRRRIPRVWQARMPLLVELRLRNNTRLTSSYSLRGHDKMADGETLGAAFFDYIPPRRSETAQEYECYFRKRGVYRLKQIEVATRFPFGLIERVLKFDQPAELLVLPQTISVSAHMEEARVDLGDYQSHQKGLGSGLYGLRGYTPEFPARDIHWKISARRGNLVVREYESEERRRAIVILDNRIQRTQQREMADAFERAIVLTASVVEWLCQTDHEVELRTASGIVGFGTGGGHVARCRRALARLEMVDPADGDSHLLTGGDDGVINFPVLMAGHGTRGPGMFPVSIDEFSEDLRKALGGDDTAGGLSVLVPAGEAAARI
ncbi:MAG: DUF58 domain-containing protein [FCB group bacterium]|jgi:uncharacterized protein (DUF58 family)|nr:DUF58 domain-containing protein [FCB group bacterium]